MRCPVGSLRGKIHESKIYETDVWCKIVTGADRAKLLPWYQMHCENAARFPQLDMLRQIGAGAGLPLYSRGSGINVKVLHAHKNSALGVGRRWSTGLDHE